MFDVIIKKLRKERNLSQKDLASAVGVTQQAVGKWETGKSSPDTTTLSALAAYFNTTLDYLITGTERTMETVIENVVSVRDSRSFSIPVIGEVRAGYNALAYNDDYGYEYANVSGDPENYFFLIVRGNSMEPRIKDGDLALVRKQNTLNDGDLGVIVYGDNEGTLKRFVKKGNTIILQPFNPEYEAKIITGEDLNDVYIAGKVIETRTQW